MFISKETLNSSYWSFCWICLDLSCHYWVIRCWPHFLGWSYLACLACYCTRSSTVCTSWFQIYAKLSTRIKPKSSFKTRRGDLNWSGSKSFKLDCGPNISKSSIWIKNAIDGGSSCLCNWRRIACSCWRADDKDRIRLILESIDEVASRIVT